MGLLIYLLMLAINIYFWIIIATVVISWLVVFGVLNTRNKWVYKGCNALNSLVDPVTNRIRKLVPPIGGIDISPMILIFGLFFLQKILASFLIY